MACNCKRNNNRKFKWTDGATVIVYDTEMAAKAKVLRVGGSYVPVDATTLNPVE